MNAVDFDTARPSPSALVAAGVRAVIRYTAGAGGKAITAAELSTYRAVGLVWVPVVENTATDAESGYKGGQLMAAQSSFDIAALIGQGSEIGQPRYFAVDENVGPLDVVGYFVGIRSTIPLSLIGVYGSMEIIQFLQSVGLATYGYRSGSASYPDFENTEGAYILQLPTSSGFPDVDADQLLVADVGQYPRP